VINTANSRIVGVRGNEEQVNWHSSYGQPTLHALVEGGEMEVPESGADIVIDFDVGRSFVQEFPGSPFTFIPWIRAVNRAATGSIVGSVQASLLDGRSLPVANATITVFRGSAYSDEGTWSVAATARTDAQGDYKVAFLMPGSYIVRAEAPGARQLAGTPNVFLHADTRNTTSVARGSDTPLSFALSELDRSYIGIAGQFALAPGDTAELSVVVSDADGWPVADPVVNWTSTNPGVATVTGSGRTARVAGITIGTTTVIARSGELADSVPITVTDSGDPGTGGGGNSGVPVASLSITPASVGVAAGDTIVFVATPIGSDGQTLTNRTVTWSVSDSTVATFMSARSGPPYAVFRARAQGAVSISAICEGETAIARLTVQ
jgi:hypothetical protein